jgi:hypothetical protein
MDRVAGGEPEPWLERLRARDPANATLHYMQARLALERGEFEARASTSARSLQRGPTISRARVGLAGTLADLGDASEARSSSTSRREGVERAGTGTCRPSTGSEQLAQRTGPPEEAQQLGALFEQLTRARLSRRNAR